MAKAATTAAANSPPPPTDKHPDGTGGGEPAKVLTPKEEREAAYRKATLRHDFEELKPGEYECTGVWFPYHLPDATRNISLGKHMTSITQLSGTCEKIVMQVNGAVRVHMSIVSGPRLPAGSMNYVVFGPGSYSHVEAMPVSPEELGIVKRLPT
jgi:hypothetical protein